MFDVRLCWANIRTFEKKNQAKLNIEHLNIGTSANKRTFEHPNKRTFKHSSLKHKRASKDMNISEQSNVEHLNVKKRLFEYRTFEYD